MKKWKFIRYTSIYDPEVILFALENDAVEKTLDGFKFIECTTDFKRVQFVRLDSLKADGFVIKEYPANA